MNNKRNRTSLLRKFELVLPTSLLLCFALPLQAADPIDAGRLLREQPKSLPALPGAPQQNITPSAVEQNTADTGAKVLVKAFQIEGATLIPVAELETQLQFAVGKELSLAQLRGVAELLIAYHAQKGYLVQVILPPQEIEGGVVHIKIIEGKRGSININNQGKRANSARVQAFIDYRLAQGEPMSLEKLGEAINILNEQPGIEVKTSLKPGAGEGETDLLVSANDKPLATFNFGLSNKGSRGTGELQAVAGVALNNPTGLFDLANVLVSKSQGSIFGSGDYSLAVGNSGLRAGISFSRLVYNVTQESLSASDAHGTATTYGLKADYPLYLLNDRSLRLTGNLDAKYTRDATIAGETGNRRINLATLGLSGTQQDGFGGGGETDFGAGLVVGHSKESNAAAIATDSTTRQSIGTFGKLKFNLDRQQKITESWTLIAKLSGQFAFDNLDSTERFSLGGADGIRAYPSGEGGADEGVLLSFNLVRPFTEKLQGTLFLDAGAVHVNKHTWAGWNSGNPNLDNVYSLAGIGASVDWKITDNIALSATVATPIGSNPGRDTNGNDADSRSQDVRGWINLVGQF
ncbi:MAG: ShlB/FhaC/HecB family hemolysin secretion/activation protein [Methylophilaceae bacterium]